MKPVREKSIYSLNLDGTRIAILSCIIIAVVAVTFLIGMKFSSSGDEHLPATVPALADLGTGNGMTEADPLGLPESNGSALNQPGMGGANSQLQTVKDPLFNENPSQPDTALTAKTEPEIKHVAPKSGSQVAKKSATKKTAEAKSAVAIKKSAAVSQSAVRPAFASIRESGKTASHAGGFAVQVASFDNLTKAKTEVAQLQDLDFDAYIDRTEVHGITYFRVRIGPMKTKAQANAILEKVSLENRYAQSYIVKDI
jgi:cell division septation protein DedD